MRNKLIYILDDLRVSTFSANFLFREVFQKKFKHHVCELIAMYFFIFFRYKTTDYLDSGTATCLICKVKNNSSQETQIQVSLLH